MKTKGWILLTILGFTPQVRADWKPVSIKGTQLEKVSVQILGERGVAARCNPSGIDKIPDFTATNTTQVCKDGLRVNSGSRTQLLEVYAKGDQYIAKVKVTHAARANESGSAQKDSVKWVEFNPDDPFLQIYDEKTGAVHSLDKYLDAAAAGNKVEIPAFEEEEESLDAVTAHKLEEAPQGDDPGAVPTQADIVTTESEMEVQEEFQSAPPGTFDTAPTAPITEVTTAPLPENSNYCQMPIEEERVNETSCPFQPSQRINGKWRNCPDREANDINRHGDGTYRDWLVELVNKASQEVSLAPQGSGSSCASPAIMMSLMDQESTFNPMAGGNQWGDVGIAQFQLGTAQHTLRYLKNVAAPDSPMHNLVEKGLTWLPEGCSATSTPWKTLLTARCQKAIEEQCVENGKLVASLYCPQFAVRLQAYHIKQICEEEVEINGINVTTVLQGDGDPVAQARFVVSRYNRGMRIYNSAAHYHAIHGKFPSAHEYGELWSIRRPSEYANRSADPYQGGNLAGQTINRCYNWRIAGLCGGVKGTIFNHYLNLTCAKQSSTPTVQGVPSTGVTND